uniref:FAS1 domain-containing protein n=1 Tax=Romanomermis culicivorax TaxID=13658 RepID=A0A915K317_ROMCU
MQQLNFEICLPWLVVFTSVLLSDVTTSSLDASEYIFNDLESTLVSLKLTRFLELLHSSELKHLLHERDRVTLFAPTDEAWRRFEMKNDDDRDSKKLSENDKYSSNLLKYHVVDGVPNLWSNYFRNEELVPTILWGTSLRLNIQMDDDGKKMYTVNGHSISKADVNASNGIVHVIDDVLYPVAPRNLYETVARNRKFTAHDEPLTAFVPIDQAFKTFPDYFAKGLFDSLPAMTALVHYHMTNGTFYFPEGSKDHRIRSLEGSFLDIKTSKDNPGQIIVNKEAKILASQAASNGVVHYVDGILTPEANPRQMLYSYKEHNIAPQLIRRHRK